MSFWQQETHAHQPKYTAHLFLPADRPCDQHQSNPIETDERMMDKYLHFCYIHSGKPAVFVHIYQGTGLTLHKIIPKKKTLKFAQFFILKLPHEK